MGEAPAPVRALSAVPKVPLALGGLALAVLVVGAPLVATPYLLRILIMTFYGAYLAQSWNLVGGYAGQFSFGHATFFGLGAYTTALLFAKGGISPWLGMLVGAVLAAGAGVFIGFLSFRYSLRGPYFALVTLAFAEVCRIAVTNWRALGGAMGVLIPLRPSPWTLQFSEPAAYYYIIVAMTAAISILALVLERSRLGVFMEAVREDVDAAEALGVDTTRTRLAAMGLSAFCTALAGTFYVQFFSYVDPHLAFGIDVSIAAILPNIIGGTGTALGPLAGSAILIPLGEWMRAYLGGYRGVHLMIYGAILVVAIIFLPRGLVGAIRRWWGTRTP
ncbi:MAG: branched-chain amino acid ABC transporter permease [Armatimonadota bacterium]|nr:branched-chain amino acid ABC transporter permease [Armatimonadota bacterium]